MNDENGFQVLTDVHLHIFLYLEGRESKLLFLDFHSMGLEHFLRHFVQVPTVSVMELQTARVFWDHTTITHESKPGN